MWDKIAAVIEDTLGFQDLKAITYDNEVLETGHGEKMIQFDYFTLHTTFGEYMEIHSQDPKYGKLQELFHTRLQEIDVNKKCSIELYSLFL